MTVRRVLSLLVVCVFAAASAAAETRYARRPLADALRDLERRGLHLIYSTDVVRPDMIVGSEPKSAEPRLILDELLREHHLHATAGPRGSLVIVRDEERQQHPPVTRAEPRVMAVPVASESIVVTPSRFTILGADPERRQFLGREEVRRIPHLSDDIYRAISRIPGTATTDVSATFNIRGGAEDEVEVLLDGAEIYDPFHFRDLFRAFSAIDAEAVGSVDVLTGGYPAQYGGRMSGVIDIASLDPAERSNEIGISLLNARAMTSGRFGSNRGEWLLSLRRGYLREVLRMIDSTSGLSPTYYDLLGKLQYTLNDHNILSAHVLGARDHLSERADGEVAHATDDDAYVWLNLRSAPEPRLFLQNVLSFGRLTRNRDGAFGVPGNSQTGTMLDRRSFDFVTLKSDGNFEAFASSTLKWGVTAKRLRANYDYDAHALILGSLFNVNGPPIRIDHVANLRESGSDLAAYVADRVKLGRHVVVEGGLRWDRQSYTPDGWHVAPRVNVAWLIGPNSSVRAAWGRFYQAQGIQELKVEDGVLDYAPSQRSEHRLIGLDQAFGAGVSLRLEAYDKKITNPRVRFENIYDRVILFPELRPDRVRLAPDRATARGMELLVRQESGGPISAWVSYARASVRDSIDGRDVPRTWDQRDAVNFSVNYRRGAFWNFNVAALYHSGWPTTAATGSISNGVFHVSIGPINAERLPPYQRVDFRASRSVVRGRASFTLFLELLNVLNQTNVTRVDGFDFNVDRNLNVESVRRTESIIGVIPAFGFNWRF